MGNCKGKEMYRALPQHKPQSLTSPELPPSQSPHISGPPPSLRLQLFEHVLAPIPGKRGDIKPSIKPSKPFCNFSWSSTQWKSWISHMQTPFVSSHPQLRSGPFSNHATVKTNPSAHASPTRAHAALDAAAVEALPDAHQHRHRQTSSCTAAMRH